MIWNILLLSRDLNHVKMIPQSDENENNDWDYQV